MSIFKSYDIRGKYPQEIDVGLACRVGRAFGRFASGKDFAVARDARLHSKILSGGLCAGGMAAGSGIVDIGLASVPQLCFTCLMAGLPGIGIGASHNPKEYNGFKPMNSDGTALGPEALNEFYRLVESPGDGGRLPGGYERRDTEPAYVENLVRNTISGERRRVAVDVSNGCGGALIGCLERLGHRVRGINVRPDGNFPAHPPEPEARYLGPLSKLAKKMDLGVALDGDADRMVAVDEKGRVLPASALIMVLAEMQLEKRRGKIIATIACSQKIEDFVRECGGKMVWSKVGRTFIDAGIRKGGFVFGGEMSGHYWFPEVYGFSDGILAAARMTQVRGRLSEVFDGLPVGIVQESKLPCPDAAKDAAVGRFGDLVRREGRLITIDGAKLVGGDFSVLLRKSNTEPVLRMSVEAESKEKAVSRLKEYGKAAAECVKRARGERRK